MKELLEVAERALRVLPPGEAERRFAAADRIREESMRVVLEALWKLDGRRGRTDCG